MKYIVVSLIMIFFSVIFPIFFLAIRAIFAYSLNRNTNQQAMKIIEQLIEQSKGKFFSITFEKKDGTTRIVNGKDKYFRLIRGGGSPATDALKAKGYKSAVNRNRDDWFSFQPEKVIRFKCGAIEKTF